VTRVRYPQGPDGLKAWLRHRETKARGKKRGAYRASVGDGMTMIKLANRFAVSTEAARETLRREGWELASTRNGLSAWLPPERDQEDQA